MNIAIVGFGNLGKSLMEQIESDSTLNLVAVFSRRKLTLEKYVSMEHLEEYTDKIDVLMLAVGSFQDFLQLNGKLVGKFNTVDSFDNHKFIEQHKKSLTSKKLSIVSVGWDPGILSLARALFSTMPYALTTTFWGKGVSQGHSNAICTIDGVVNAIQYTCPIKKRLRLAKKGKDITTDSTQNHTRLCYVCAKKEKQQFVKKSIVEMPNYFAPYRTTVRFASKQKIEKLKENMSHKGGVYSKNKFGNISFEVDMQSNPQFTASIMLAYAKAVPKLQKKGFKGAIDCLDIPLKYLIESKEIL